MKKIVSALVASMLVLGSAFAADISIEYTSKGNVYSETRTKDETGTTTTTTTTKTVLDQDGYGEATSDFVISAKSDVGGFVLDIDPSASTGTNSLDAYYGWVNLGNVTTTVGKWASRYSWRAKEDGGKWNGTDYERYKLGVIKGRYAKDIDNLTYSTSDDIQKLAAAVEYKAVSSDDMTIFVKGALVNAASGSTTSGTWGGALKNKDSGNYENTFYSSFAGEFGFKMKDVIDLDVAFRSESRDALGVGVFVRPLMLGETSMLIGASFGADIADYGDGVDHNYFEYAADFRLRTPLSDKLVLTTMNNLSSYNDAKIKDGKDSFYFQLWDMVSLAYTASEQLKLQCTVESECGVFAKKNDVKYYVRDLGGVNLSVIPGAVWTFNKNASLTAGVKIYVNNVAASNDYKSANTTSKGFSIPVVFDVAL